MTADDKLREDAEQVVKYLRDIRALLKRTEEAEISSLELTPPQIDVLRELATNNGLSLKELSARVGLAHSTVSGIVDRLEQRGLLNRQPDPDDKRVTRIYADRQVVEFQDKTLYSLRGSLVAQALQQATPEEREQIIGGIAKLYALLAAGDKHE